MAKQLLSKHHPVYSSLKFLACISCFWTMIVFKSLEKNNFLTIIDATLFIRIVVGIFLHQSESDVATALSMA